MFNFLLFLKLFRPHKLNYPLVSHRYLHFALCFCLPIIILAYSVHLPAERFGQIIDFAEMMQPHHVYNAAAMTIVQNSQKTQWSVLLQVPPYMQPMINTQQLYIQAIECTQLLHSIL